MIPDPSERVSRRKPDPLDAELDALVAREVDALSVRADTTANVARVLDIRRLSAPRAALPLAARERRRQVASTGRQAISSR